jgi:hypothetical protein
VLHTNPLQTGMDWFVTEYMKVKLTPDL